MGLRRTTSVNNESDATNEMAPALTEPIVVGQKTATSGIKSTAGSAKAATAINNLNKNCTQRDSFQLAFEKHLNSDGPDIGPLINYHMDQENVENNRIIEVSQQQQLQQQQQLEATPPTPTTTALISSIINITPVTPSQQNHNYYHHNNNNITTTPTTMGLQKERDKENAEMEQILGELASTSDIDLMQVIKNLESAVPGGDGYNDYANTLSLFNDDDDVMNICNVEEETVVASTSIKDSETAEMRVEIEKCQAAMQRKCDFLMRRLRKVQARQMGQHASEEVGNLYSDAYRLFKKKERELVKMNDEGGSSTFLPPSAEKFKPITSHAMKIFLKKINHVSSTQSASIAKRCQIVKINMDSHLSNVAPKLVNLVPEMGDKMAQKLESVAGMLQTELRMVEASIDSDATASSSGGESADESVAYNNQTQETLPISKRAAWHWAQDRSAVASRWGWLLAQISDLEYRIRQHNELHLQIKKNKGAVTFEDSPVAAAASQSPPSQQSVNGYRGVLPGNSKSMDSDISPNGVLDGDAATDPSTATGSSRTRPFQRNGFRKRKLLQTVNLHTISKKAARPSTIKCGCQWPLHPCALCTGRQDPTAPRDLPDMMPASERVALLDPCFHSVLSFPEDVSHSVHFEAITRIPEWQSKAKRTTTKTSLKGAIAAQKAAERREERISKKFVEGRRKYSKKFGLVTNKIKKTKVRRRALHGKFSHLLKKKKKHRKSSKSHQPSSGSDSMLGHQDQQQHTGQHGNNGRRADGGVSFSLPRSINASPTYAGSFSNKHDRSDIRRSRNSYDIDNIVIPYSVAASTRVELLPYKEIPTPKWRIIEEAGLEEEVKNQEEEVQTVETSQNIQEEDISEETIFVKHDRALQDERKKFQTFLKFPWSTRSRANRRTDSRAESSGANTPDPTSPAPSTPNVPADQESIPSPANTQIDGQETSDNLLAITIPVTSIQPISGNNGKRPIERRRTVSLKIVRDRDIIIRDDTRRSNTPDGKEMVPPPYEALDFPLPENLYDEMIKTMPEEHKTIFDNLLNTLTPPSSSDVLKSVEDPITDYSQVNNVDLTGLEHNVTIAASTIRGKELDNQGESDDESETESVDSTMGGDEDPNDPEWQSEKNTRSTIVGRLVFSSKHLNG